MRIHSDTLTIIDLHAATPPGCYLDAMQTGSRSRARGFTVRLTAAEGADRHGIRRVYSTNSGNYGAGHDRAATWVEWGDWIAELFKLDPAAKIGQYEGAADFVRQTTDYAPHRPARESATDHATRWADQLDGVAA